MSLPTVKRMRSGCQKGFGNGSVEFIEENGGGPGVRLKKGLSAGAIPVSKLNSPNDG